MEPADPGSTRPAKHGDEAAKPVHVSAEDHQKGNKKERIKWCLDQLNDMEELLASIRQESEVKADEKHQEEPDSAEVSTGDLPQKNATTGESAVSDNNNPIDKAIHQDGVSLGAVKGYLRKEISEAQACWQLPFALGTFIFFCLAATTHSEVHRLHAVDQAFTWDVVENANFAFAGNLPFENGRAGHKNIGDVNSFADFWSWFNLGLVPLFFPEGWDVSEARSNTGFMCQSFADALDGFAWPASALNGTKTDANIYGNIGACPEGQDDPDAVTDRDGNPWFGDPRTPTYLAYNSIVGGVRMRQEYTPAEACPNEKYKGKLYTGDCISSQYYHLEPELDEALFSREELMNHPSAPDVYFFSGSTQQEVREKTRQLENEVWLSPYAAKVELLFPTYSPSMDFLTATFVFMHINRAGHIHKLLEPVSIWTDEYRAWYFYLFDALWVLCIAKMFVSEVHELITYCRQLGPQHGMYSYIGFGNTIDWLNILYSVIIVAWWWFHLQNLSDLREMLKHTSVVNRGSFETQAEVEEFFTLIVNTVHHQYRLRRFIAFYPWVLVTGFLKVFSHQPRLALMTETLKSAAADIIHFMVVFGTIFMVWTASAMLLFGQELIEFANFGRSAQAVFQILLGDFDWDKMQRVGRLEAGLWLLSFLIVGTMVVLQMLLAIVIDKYTEVKGGIAEAETLFTQLLEIYNRNRAMRRGDAMALKEVLHQLDPTDLDDGDDDDNEEAITVKIFMQKVPGLSQDQATEILKESYVPLQSKENQGTSIAQTNVRIKEMSEVLEDVEKLVNENFKLQKRHFERLVRG